MPTVSLTVEPSAPNHGDTLTATYVVDGNDPVDPKPGVVDASGSVGDVPFTVHAEWTVPGTAALPESFDVPTAEGLTFSATDDPHTFTALVP